MYFQLKVSMTNIMIFLFDSVEEYERSLNQVASANPTTMQKDYRDQTKDVQILQSQFLANVHFQAFVCENTFVDNGAKTRI